MGTKGGQRALDRELQRPGGSTPASLRWGNAAEALVASRGTNVHQSVAAEVVARLQGGRPLPDGTASPTGSGPAVSNRVTLADYAASGLLSKADASHKKPFAVGKGVDQHGNIARAAPTSESIAGMGVDPSSPPSASSTPYSIYTGKLRSLAGFAKGPREPLEKKPGATRRANGIPEEASPVVKPHHHHVPRGKTGHVDADRPWDSHGIPEIERDRIERERPSQPRSPLVHLESSPYFTPGVTNLPSPVQVPSNSRPSPAARPAAPRATPLDTVEPETPSRDRPGRRPSLKDPGDLLDTAPLAVATQPPDAPARTTVVVRGSESGERPLTELDSPEGVLNRVLRPGDQPQPEQRAPPQQGQGDGDLQALQAPDPPVTKTVGERKSSSGLDGAAAAAAAAAAIATPTVPAPVVGAPPLDAFRLPESRFQDITHGAEEADEEDHNGEDEDHGGGYGTIVALNASLRGPSHEPTSPTLHRSEPLYLGMGSATGASGGYSSGIRQAVNQSFGLEGGAASGGENVPAGGGLLGRLKTSAGGGSSAGVPAGPPPQITEPLVASASGYSSGSNKGPSGSHPATRAPGDSATVAAEDDESGSTRHRRASEAWTIHIRQDGPGVGTGDWEVSRSEPPLAHHLVVPGPPPASATPAATAAPSQGVPLEHPGERDSSPATPRTHRSGRAPRRQSRDLQSLDIRNPRDMRMSLDIPASPTSPWGGALSPLGPPSSHGRHAEQPFLDDMVNKPFARRVGGRGGRAKSGRKRAGKDKEPPGAGGSGPKERSDRDKGGRDKGGRDKRKDKGKDRDKGGFLEAIRAAREARKDQHGLGVAVAVPAQVLKAVAANVFSKIRLWPPSRDRVSTSHITLLGDGRTVKDSWRGRVRSLFHRSPRRVSNDLDLNNGPVSGGPGSEFSNVERIGRLSMGGPYGMSSPGSGGYPSLASPDADGMPREGARSAWDSGPGSPASAGAPSSPTAHDFRRHAAPKARSRMALLLWHRAVRRVQAVNSVWSILVRSRMERMQPLTLVFYNSPQLEKKYKDTRMRYMMANLGKMVLLATLLLVISTVTFLAMPPTDRDRCKPWWALVAVLYLFLGAMYLTTTRMRQSLLQYGATRKHYWLVLALPPLLSLVLGVGVMLLRDIGTRRFLPLQSDIALALLALTFCQHLASQTAARILVVVAGFFALNLAVLIHPAMVALEEEGDVTGLDVPPPSGQDDDGTIPRVAFINLILALYSITLLGAGYSREWDDRRSFILTSQVSASKVRSEALLENMLPRSILRALEGGRTLISEEFEEVSIMFIYIDGFNTYTASTPPKKLITFLNDVFSAIDNLCETREVYKIETVSDVYMVGGGVPDPCDDHAERVGLLALELIKLCTNWEVSERTGNLPLRLRIGVHCGPIVAGVIGLKRLHYRVFGDTVNMASRMGSHGAVGKVHCSEAFHNQLIDQKFTFKSRGVTNIKGKGPQNTYYLLNGPPGTTIGGTTSPLNESFSTKGDTVKPIRPIESSPPSLPIPVPSLESSIGRRMRFSEGDGFLGASFTSSLRARQQQSEGGAGNGGDTDITAARVGPSPLQPSSGVAPLTSPPLYSTIHVPEHDVGEILAGLATASTHAFKGRGDLPRQLRLISSARCRPLILDREDLVPGAADGLAMPVSETSGHKPATGMGPRPMTRPLSGGSDRTRQAPILENVVDDENAAAGTESAAAAADGTANPAVKRKPLGKTRLKVLRAVAAAPAPLMALRNDQVEAMCAAAVSPRRKDSDPGASSSTAQDGGAITSRAPGQAPRRRRMSVSAALHGAMTSDILSSLHISDTGGSKKEKDRGSLSSRTGEASPTKKLTRFKTMLQPRASVPYGVSEAGLRPGLHGAIPELRPTSGATDGSLSRGASPVMAGSMGPSPVGLRGVLSQSHAVAVDLEAPGDDGGVRRVDTAVRASSPPARVPSARDGGGISDLSGPGQTIPNPLLSSFGSSAASSSVRSIAHLSTSPSSERRGSDGLPGAAATGGSSGSFHHVVSPSHMDASDVRSEASGQWPAVWPEDAVALATLSREPGSGGPWGRGHEGQAPARVRPGTAAAAAPRSTVVKRSSFNGANGAVGSGHPINGRPPSKAKGGDLLALAGGTGGEGVLGLLSPDHWWQAPEEGAGGGGGRGPEERRQAHGGCDGQGPVLAPGEHARAARVGVEARQQCRGAVGWGGEGRRG
eukprot:jgi/Mesvir1/8924/Mv25095-RA.1